MGFDQILPAILGAGGVAFLTALGQIFLAWRKGRLESEATLIERLNTDSRQQGIRADRAEERADRMAAERNAALDQAARYRRRLLDLGADVEPVVTPDEH